MKLKKILLFIIILFACFKISIAKDLNATSLPHWEFYPEGMNYLNPDNFYFNMYWPVGYYANEYHIKVKPNTEYTLTAFAYQALNFKHINLYFYDSNKKFINMINQKQETTTEYTFITSGNTEYLKLNIEVNLCETYEEYGIVDNYIALHEEKISPPYNHQELKYKGPKIDYTIISPNQSGYIIKSFDEELTLSSILNSLYAYDDRDGNITKNINTILDNYSSNENILGEYDIIFEIQDSSENITTLQLFITNIDLVLPTIDGPSHYETTQHERIMISDILSNLNAIDNYDGDISSKIELHLDNYSDNYHKIGTYEIVFKVSDSSDNINYYTVEVIVDDSTPPVITGPEKFYRNKDDVLTVQYIKSLLRATDNIDGDITNRILVEYDEYTMNSHRYNEWEIIFSVADNAGNITYYTVAIEVIDNIPPVFLYDQNIINLDLKNNNLSMEGIIRLLKRTNKIKEDEEVEVLVDEYTANKEKAGSYKVVLEVKNEKIELTVNIIDNLNELLNPVEKTSIWTKIIEIIILILKCIWVFLRGIFV